MGALGVKEYHLTMAVQHLVEQLVVLAAVAAGATQGLLVVVAQGRRGKEMLVVQGYHLLGVAEVAAVPALLELVRDPAVQEG